MDPSVRRSKRSNFGFRRQDTFYHGTPDTRKASEAPTAKLVGKRIEIYFRPGGWTGGIVREYHPFDGMNVVNVDGKGMMLFDLGHRRFRIEGEDEVIKLYKTDDGSTQPKRAKKTTAKGKAGKKNDDNDADNGSDHGDGIAVVAQDGEDATSSHHHTANSNAIKVVAGRPQVDPESGLANRSMVYEHNDVVYDADLAFLDLAHNHDKYYKLQVLEAVDKSEYWCMHHWGRTGAKGQTQIFSYKTPEEAIDDFEKKFTAKSGNEWKDRATAKPKAGKYKLKRKVYAGRGDATEAEGSHVMWQYYVDDFVDGKATGWYNYTETAAATVEGVHSEWTHNSDWLDVRCVQSGYFQYRVDFNSMTQTNLSTQKCRKIRRVVM
eukprot:TRINITY_DN6438_c0_g1_i1.p1 TRINITY_DN6438_c0_g1~~TRINITY_DN6438_c0_g1_i1.p1  ORF type:complete len:377 (+),score=121.07 TRINITY_DN6438_c0_g1_i1:86-1216(+)